MVFSEECIAQGLEIAIVATAVLFAVVIVVALIKKIFK